MNNLTSEQITDLINGLSGALDTLALLPGWGNIALHLSDLVVQAEVELIQRGEVPFDFTDVLAAQHGGAEMIQ